MGLFLGTYLVTDLGGPPIANQLVGVFLFAPMVAGSYVASRVNIAPHRLVFYTELALLPISVVMATFVVIDAAQMWMIYPFQFAYGVGGMVNMAVQRGLLFTMAGPLRSTRVLNVEITGTASAMMLGPLLGGLTIQAFGLGVAFAIPAAMLAVSLPLLWSATRGSQHLQSSEVTAVGASVVGGGADWRLLRRSRALVVILLVTVICNLCYFAFLPLVPVIAAYLDAGAAMAGVIGATAGVVQLLVAATLIVRPARRPWGAYVFGVALCLCSLGVVAYTPVLSLVLVALGVAGIGQALFGSTQATLPVDSVAPHERAAALGLLTTTIGVALPAGMIVLGIASGLLGTRPAMLVSALIGLTALTITLLWNRPVLRAAGGAVRIGGEGNTVSTQP